MQEPKSYKSLPNLSQVKSVTKDYQCDSKFFKYLKIPNYKTSFGFKTLHKLNNVL